MAEPTLYDNDAVLKLSAYGCGSDIAATGLVPPAILAVARWSLAGQIRKARKVLDADRFRIHAEQFVAQCIIIEPAEDELLLAAAIEEDSIAAGGDLDSGESQLAAVLVTRNLSTMVTGDKRAIRTLAALQLDGLCGRICCIEQVLALIVNETNWEHIRHAVCSERELDRAIAIVFACHSPGSSLENIRQGLNSYIADLRSVAPLVLRA